MPEAGEVAVLNVGAGDVKLSFNNSDPAETIRAGRIVKDMLRRGFALLVEVERGGERRFERALDFDEGKSQYVIADFDPVEADKVDAVERELSRPLAEIAVDKGMEDDRGEGGESTEAAPSKEG